MAEFPNECWQADVTHVEVADGVVYEVLNVIDDHSRLCVASRAFVTTRSPDVVRTVHKAAGDLGLSAAFLDRQRAHLHHAEGIDRWAPWRLELLSLGIATRHSRPYHPQTCGKVERFHQTLKKFLAKQEPATTKKLLQGQLNRFVELLQRPSGPIAASAGARPSRLGAPGRRRAHRRSGSTPPAIGSATTRSTAAVR